MTHLGTMRAWRNRKTHRTQNATGNTVGVQIPPRAPLLSPIHVSRINQTNEDHHERPAQTRGLQDPERT
jgi:hypothetical protein